MKKNTLKNKFCNLLTLILLVTASKNSSAQCNANFTYTISGNTVNVTSISTGTTASTAHQWNFVGSNVWGGLNSSYTYTTAGTVTVCLTILSSTVSLPTCTNTTCYTITVGSSSVTGIRDNSLTNININPYPVPCSEVLYLNPKIEVNEIYDVVMFDLLGNRVANYKGMKQKDFIDVSKLSNGLYTLEYSFNGNKTSKKIVVSR